MKNGKKKSEKFFELQVVKVEELLLRRVSKKKNFKIKITQVVKWIYHLKDDRNKPNPLQSNNLY